MVILNATNMNKYTVKQIREIIGEWESVYGESFVDYFVDDNICSMHFLLGYFCGKFPDLGKFIMDKSDWSIVWGYVQDGGFIKETNQRIDSIAELIEQYCNDDWDLFATIWATVIYDNDPYYERFVEWLSEYPSFYEKFKLNEDISTITPDNRSN